MIRTFEQRHSAGGVARPCLGGGGSSSSSSQTTNTTTNNTDKRIVADATSSVASVDGSNNSVTMTDHGAVTAALNANSTNTDHLLATADHLFSMQAQSQQATADLTNSLVNGTQAAYKDAANQASGNKQLIIAGMAVVAVVAFHSFGKR